MGVEWHRSSLNEEIINASVAPYWRVRVINETSSTQNDLANLVNSGNAQSGEVIIAEYQSAGRGRLDRNFVAPPKSSLLFSLYLQNEIENNWLPLIAGLAICKVIPNSQLKWPNDIQINYKKCGGILAEKVYGGVIVGIGLNVSQSQEELPIPEATSLIQNELSANRDELLISILHELGKLFRNWPANKPEVFNEYLAKSSTIGKEVEVALPNGEKITGLAKTLSAKGELVVGNTEVQVGDVRHLRLMNE